VFTDGEPDPRNGVHYDLIVAQGVGLLPAELLSADKAERKAARAALRPLFDELLALLGEPRRLPERPAEAEG
jgi:hypothetical protein